MKITELQVETLLGMETDVVIDDENGHFTWMRKSLWEKLQAEQSTPSVTSGD